MDEEDEDLIPGATCHCCNSPAVVEWWDRYYCRACADDVAEEIDAHRRKHRIPF